MDVAFTGDIVTGVAQAAIADFRKNRLIVQDRLPYQRAVTSIILFHPGISCVKITGGVYYNILVSTAMG
jgi:hypothetical protein